MNIRGAISGLLIVIFVLVAISNVSGAICSRIRRTNFSLAPFLGGLLGCLGFWPARHPTAPPVVAGLPPRLRLGLAAGHHFGLLDQAVIPSEPRFVEVATTSIPKQIGNLHEKLPPIIDEMTPRAIDVPAHYLRNTCP